MSIKVTVSSDFLPLLDKIFELNYGYGLQALDHAGMVIQKNTRAEMRNQMHQWFQYYRVAKKGENKGKKIRVIQKMNNFNQLGQRISHKSKNGSFAKPQSMSSFVTSFLMKKSMTVIVGGTHKAFTAEKFRDGRVVGSAGRVNAVSRSTHALLRKLESGDADSEYTKKHRPKSMSRFGDNPNYQKRNFYAKGRNRSMGEVKEIMTTKLESLLQKAYNRANITVSQSSTRGVS